MGTYGAIVTALYQRERPARAITSARRCWPTGCGPTAARCRRRCAATGSCRSRRARRRRTRCALHYRCRDGRWLLLSIASDEWRWDKFKACLDDPALDDPRFADVARREANAGALVVVLDRIFATRELAEWRRVLDDAGIIFGIVAEVGDIAEDAQALAAGHIVPVADADYMTVNSPIEIRGQEKLRPRRAPLVGEHSEEVLRDLGYPDAEIAALRAAGVIG